MHNSKFKVGDKVKIVRDTCFHHFAIGEIKTITYIDINHSVSQYYFEHDNVYGNYCQDDDLELVTSKKPEVLKIGDKVIIKDSSLYFIEQTDTDIPCIHGTYRQSKNPSAYIVDILKDRYYLVNYESDRDGLRVQLGFYRDNLEYDDGTSCMIKIKPITIKFTDDF